MKLGNLEFNPVIEYLDILGEPVKVAIDSSQLKDVLVAEIDANLSDTAAFCEKYGIDKELAANCVIVEAKRGDQVWYAACVIQGAKRADVNGIVRRELNARKISFAPVETAVSLSGMEFGAISPIGLPADWPIFVDEGVAKLEHAIIGSGIRKSKLLVAGSLLASLPNVKVMALTKS